MDVARCTVCPVPGDQLSDGAIIGVAAQLDRSAEVRLNTPGRTLPSVLRVPSRRYAVLSRVGCQPGVRCELIAMPWHAPGQSRHGPRPLRSDTPNTINC